MTRVFLSYANNDSKVAEAVQAAFLQSGRQVGENHSIITDERIESAIMRAVAQADYVIVLWSAFAAQSQWVAHELELAIHAWSNGRLILVSLDASALPAGLRDLQTITLNSESPELFGAGLRKILARVEHLEAEDLRPVGPP